MRMRNDTISVPQYLDQSYIDTDGFDLINCLNNIGTHLFCIIRYKIKIEIKYKFP